MPYKDPVKAREYNTKWRRKYREANREKENEYHREYSRKWREEKPEKAKEQKRRYYESHKDEAREYYFKYKDANPEKIKAQNLAQYIPSRGICEHCKKEGPTDKHHESYDRPLDVIHLCRRCHARHHVDLKLKTKGEKSYVNRIS